MRATCLAWILLFAASPLPAAAQAPATVLRDLESYSPSTLTKADLEALLPGAKISRIATSGNEHAWKNDADGTFIVSSTNKAQGDKPSTGRGKWHIAEDGRYCVLIEWRASSEDWCRFVLKTSDGYYSTKSLNSGTEKVYKLNISK